ncbi:hypothetical protein [Saccharothrix luteola]|uniref:hypothetical protein n=1 Tax=Saccharothrix luteola TaxID=2893018 RepID=UPI003558AB31
MVGGPNLAASFRRLGLIDEYRVYVHPCCREAPAGCGDRTRGGQPPRRRPDRGQRGRRRLDVPDRHHRGSHRRMHWPPCRSRTCTA